MSGPRTRLKNPVPFRQKSRKTAPSQLLHITKTHVHTIADAICNLWKQNEHISTWKDEYCSVSRVRWREHNECNYWCRVHLHPALESSPKAVERLAIHNAGPCTAAAEKGEYIINKNWRVYVRNSRITHSCMRWCSRVHRCTYCQHNTSASHKSFEFH